MMPGDPAHITVIPPRLICGFEVHMGMRGSPLYGKTDAFVLPAQALSLGLGDRWEKVKDDYAHANRALGDIVKVTPSSKVGPALQPHACLAMAQKTHYHASIMAWPEASC